MVVPWFLQNLIVVDGCGMDGWFLLVLMTISHVVWVCNLSKLVKYLRVERYLAAKIGTISWFFFGGSSLLRMVDVFFIVLLGFCCFLISAFIR